MKNWVYKEKYIVKMTLKKILPIIATFLAIEGILLTIAESVHCMFESDVIYEWLHRYVWIIIIMSLIASWIKNRVKLSFEYFIENTDVQINMVVGDVLKYDGAIVIPTNTTFDTKMEDEFISVRSVQGQFQKKYFSDNLEELDELLEKDLNEYSNIQINKSNSKTKQYPLGSVSKVSLNNQHYYFVAIADINEYGKPINTKFENIQMALEGLWKKMEYKGHIENIIIPLIGTGKAGIRDAHREKVIKEIIFSFVACARERKITEKLIICIHPTDLAHKDLQLSNLDEYLRYMCQYQYSNNNAAVEGNREG